MSTPRVSIIMPAYNRGYIIAAAIESVLAQTYSDFELIVVDDGSRDNTCAVVSGFADGRIQLLRHPGNRGCSAAYNTGFLAARGEFIAILDSDDLWKPDKLAREVEFLDWHPEAGAVFADLEKQDGRCFAPSFMRESAGMTALLKAQGWPPEIVFTQREIYLCLLREVPIKPTAFTMRRSAREQTGLFAEDWPSGSDWEFLLRFSKPHRIGYIDRPLAVLRVQSDATHRRHAIVDKSLVLGMLRRELRQARDAEVRAAASFGYWDMARHLSWHYLRNGQRRSASRTLVHGFIVTRRANLLARSAYALVRSDMNPQAPARLASRPGRDPNGRPPAAA